MYMSNIRTKASLSTQVTYGKGLLINMQKLALGHFLNIILINIRVKIGRIAQHLVLNPVKLIFFGNRM